MLQFRESRIYHAQSPELIAYEINEFEDGSARLHVSRPAEPEPKNTIARLFLLSAEDAKIAANAIDGFLSSDEQTAQSLDFTETRLDEEEIGASLHEVTGANGWTYQIVERLPSEDRWLLAQAAVVGDDLAEKRAFEGWTETTAMCKAAIEAVHRHWTA